MTQSSQPTKSKILPPVRVDEELYRCLAAEAARQERTLSSLMRFLLTQAVEQPRP